jgi:hypothetical protein
MIPRPEQTGRWASQEAAIKAEINEAKNTLDLIRMAHAIARLDALHAEIEAASKADDDDPSGSGVSLACDKGPAAGHPRRRRVDLAS